MKEANWRRERERLRLQMRNPAAAAKGTGSTESTMRRLQPELSGYHGNLSSGPPHPSCQDNDTTGWEGCGEW